MNQPDPDLVDGCSLARLERADRRWVPDGLDHGASHKQFLEWSEEPWMSGCCYQIYQIRPAFFLIGPVLRNSIPRLIRNVSDVSTSKVLVTGLWEKGWRRYCSPPLMRL